ncbi:hypothetical protein F5Y09DRAFT_156896 [Xylaria sp. FL1042]|nr:hypothetical protein F5Y09DRAFT_156896 [Xylaria sp. FL1042]
MMLSRSGLSIRKLIPNRRLSDEDLGGAELRKDDSLLVSWTEQDGGANPYAANRRSSRKKRAPTPIIATSPLTHSDILRPLPPLPSETPRSSASSSCRCDLHARCDCPLLNLKRRSPLYSIPPKEASEDPTLLSCVNSTDPDDSLTHHIPKSRFNSFSDAKSKEEVTKAFSPTEQDKEETLKDQQAEGTLSQELSNDVRQFMQEAEDAFKVIGASLSEVHVSKAAVFQTTKASSLDVPHDIEPPPPTPPPKETPVPLSKTPSTKALSMFSSSPKSSPKDNSPARTPKRKNSKKSKRTRSMRPTRKSTAPKQAVKSGPRWTLTENVSELLTGKLFHRIEADEMLTPDQIEAFKQQRITKLQVEKMAEALEQELVGSIESLYLDDLPSRVESPGVKTDITTTQAEEKPAIAFSEDVVRRDFLFERQHKNYTPPIPPRRRSAFHKSNTPPITSSRHVRSSSRRIMTELPIIPETSITPRTSGDSYSSNESIDSLGNSSTSEYVYLESPRFSLIHPGFQHGPIRLSKCDLLPDMKLAHDENLDWTAFQMAISGGAGDLFSDSDDALCQWEQEDIADITEWWDSWHFESTGELVTRDYEASSPTSTLSGDEIPDLSYSELESDNPNSPHLKGRDPKRKTGAPGLQLDLGFTKDKKPMPTHYLTHKRCDTNDTWRQDNEMKQSMVNRQSVNSLPPSPMLDLRVIRSESGDDLDVVPMGYNLGHDLGDFLKWEAEHAFAGDFNSPSGLM